MKKSKIFNFTNKSSVITYDLSPNETSAHEIELQSTKLHTTVTINKVTYSLPNTTLNCFLNREDAEKEFRNALSKALKINNKKDKITKLFIMEVNSQKGFIENDE